MYIGGVVACTTAVVVASLVYAVVDVEAEERSGRIEREHAFYVVVHTELQVDEVHHLAVPGVVEVVEGLEAARVAGLNAELLARRRVDAVVQGDFQNLRRVQITRQQIGFLAEGSHLDATRAAALACVLQGLTFAHQLLDVGVGIEDGGIAVALTDDADARQQELVGCVLGNVDAQSGLQLVQFLLNFENHVGQLIDRTLSFPVHATDVDVGKVVVCARLQCRHANLWRRRLVVELNPEARQEFLGVVARQGAFGQPLLIEGP